MEGTPFVSWLESSASCPHALFRVFRHSVQVTKSCPYLSQRDFLHFSRTNAETVSPTRQTLLPGIVFSWFKVGISTGNMCVFRVLLGKPGGRRPLGRPRRRWVDNIMMDLQEVGCGCMDWIGLAQDRDRWRTLVSAVMNIRVP